MKQRVQEGTVGFCHTRGAAQNRGAVLDGMAAGVPVDEAFVAACMDKRRARASTVEMPGFSPSCFMEQMYSYPDEKACSSS